MSVHLSTVKTYFKSNPEEDVSLADLNVVNVPASLVVSGRLFHNDGPATKNEAHRPYRSRLYRGIVKER